MDATYLFAKTFVNTKYDDLPSDVVEATKKEILDLLGVAVGGFGQRGAREVLELISDWGGKAESSIIGSTMKVPAPNAAQANATMAHSLDFDDVHEAAVMHPGIAVIPVCMAVGERKGSLSGKEFIAATALGVDMMCRLALATTPGRSPITTGWHLTSIFGYLGAAATAARMLKFDEEKTVDAIGIAYHQSGGNGQCVKDGALTKRLGPGFAVKGGITAALMAEKGVTGAKNCLEGEMGLYPLYMRGDYGPEILRDGLGKKFEGVNVAIKPYPCCRGVHPAIDSARELVLEANIAADDIQEILLTVCEAHQFLLCTPAEVKRNPRTPVDAQFSIPWGVATAILKGQVTLDDFTEAAMLNSRVLALTARMKVEVDDSMSRTDRVDPTGVTITTRDGRTFSKVVENTLGSLERPMSFDDCARKFTDCAKRLGDERISRVIELVAGLDKLEDAGQIMEQLRLP